MQKSKFLLVLFLISSGFAASAQQLVSGFVRDTGSNEAIIGAVVKCLETDQNTASNNYGFYSLALPSGHYTIVFSYPGYQSDTMHMSLYKSQKVDAFMQSDESLKNSNYIPDENTSIEGQVQPGSQQISSKKVEKLPLLLGEVDVIKAAQLLPGVKSGTEGSSGLYVRGGGRGQNLVLLDGVPVYNQNHLFGFFSTFNNDGINSLQLYKGSFPARFGGRLSSVMDVTLKDGNAEIIEGTASIGALLGRVSLNGPLSSDGRTTFAFSGRRSYIDLLIRPIENASQSDSFQNQTDFYFYDFNAKVSHQLDDRNRLYFSYYQSKDVLGLSSKFTDTFRGALRETELSTGLNWVSNTAVARYTRLQNNNIFANYAVSYTRYQIKSFADINFKSVSATTQSDWHYKTSFVSGLQDINLLAEYDYKPSQNHHLRYGVNSTIHMFKPGQLTLDVDLGAQQEDTTRGEDQDQTTVESAIFIEDVIQINKGTKANVGLRVMNYLTNGKSYVFVEPRLALNEEIDSHWIFRMSYALNNQPIHLLANSNTGLPLDLWVPATNNIKPQSGHQFSLGFIGNLKHGFQFIGEVYYKWLRNAIDYAPGANFLAVDESWQNNVLQGRGQNYGLELFVQKQLGRTTGWASYTLSYADRTIEGINSGRTYPFRYDQRHNLSTSWSYALSDRQTLGFTTVFGTGFPITIPIGQYLDLDGNVVYEYGGKNNYRMENYFRLDLNYVHHKKKSKLKWAKDAWFNVSIYNATARKNPFIYQISRSGPGKNGLVLERVSLFQFIPSFSYNVAF